MKFRHEREFFRLGLYARLEMREKGTMGRFGAGWNWKVGFQIGGTTIIFNLLVMQVVIRRIPKFKRKG